MRDGSNDRISGDPGMDSESRWLAGVREGSEAAFTQLFHRYYPRIWRFAFRIVLDTQSADDVAQETFLRVAGRIVELRSDAAFEPWLYRIARNVASDLVRKEKAHRRKLGHFAEQADGMQPDSGETGEAGSAALQALGKLSAAQREAVALVYLEGFSHGEAAQRLGCAESTVSWRIFRARVLLRKQLAAPEGR